MKEKKESVRYASVISLHTMLMCVGLNYVTYYLSDKGLSASRIGIVVSISCMIAVIAQQLTGRMVDNGKLDPKRLICLLSSILTIAGLCMSFFDTGALRPVLFGLMICITLAILPLLNSFTFYYHNNNININYGIARGVGSLCFSVCSIVLGYLTVYAGSFTVPLTYGLLGCGVCAIVFFMPSLKSGPAKQQDGAGASGPKPSTHPQFFLMLLGLSLVMLFHNMVMTYFIYVIRRAGGDSSDMGMAIGIAAVLEIPVLFLYTRIKGSRPSVYFLMTSGIAFLLKSILFIFAQNILMIYVIQLLQCMAYGLMAASRVYYVDELVGKENEATGQAYMSATETTGIVLGSALGGLIMQKSSVDILLTAGAVICLTGTLCMILSCIWTERVSIR